MYLTAQHVRAPVSDAEGVNAFFYLHGTDAWDELAAAGIPDRNPGTLAAQSITLPPPGNRVRSYLDIVAPDETPWSEIHQAFVVFVSRSQRQPLPWVGAVGRFHFRIGVELSLVGRLQQEIADLYRAAQSVRIGG
jgi:hypothetical protein